MKYQLTRRSIIVKKSPIHGYGVFADEDILSGEVIEESHVIRIQKEDISLNNYCYEGKGEGEYLLPFGCGCIYNHARNPNAKFSIDAKHDLLIFRARENIRKGEEIFIDYGKNWFKDRGFDEKDEGEERLSFDFRSLIPMTIRFSFVLSIILLMVVFKPSILPFTLF